ncbi:MAG: LysR family transcriptional regulator [Deltaproteobacteria bacterium]|nr:LysR family transcriptional regulator [Deltaproteobacteria bacterium]
METSAYVLRTHVWFETSKGNMVFGLGRVLLLQKVQEFGSLNKAAQAMNMSYRAAWGKIRSTEEEVGGPLLVREKGRRGFVLTDLGRELLDSYTAFQNEVEAFANEKALARFPWSVRPYQDSDRE